MDERNPAGGDERIDLNDAASCERWARRLNVTHEQMREAVQAVGGNPGDVEIHLKGVRSSSNDERVEQALHEDSPREGPR